ncbi:major facilitator superfamily domain-containing protein [Aspergillus pseudoustus]|uniref:Major facilitator superfamily domain-containing protein n=1 Tax=Aspergillus pseudoustus TaxID=1810923 RepID=A0ABR4JCM3_9EURO
MAKEYLDSVSEEMSQERNAEAQSTFATSTLVADVEKATPAKVTSAETQHKSIYGMVIDTSCSNTGCGAVFEGKLQLLNKAMLDLGMGKYQWFLFLMTGVGWFLDSFWITSFTIINPSASNEALFFLSGDKSTYLPVSLFVGLTTGATAWPWMSDTLGRKWIFTSTVVLMGMGGLVGAGMPSFTGLCVVGCVVGIAIGGNQSVDGMILLEMLPASHQFLLAAQGAFWGLGQVVAYAMGWAFIAEYTCGTGPDSVSTEQVLGGNSKRAGSSSGNDSSSSCHYVSNKGWRYVWWTFGCITLFLYLCRFLFPLRETPRHLLSRRRDAEATQIVRDIAAYNKRQTWLTEASFARIDSTTDTSGESARRRPRIHALLSSLGPAGLPALVALWSMTGLTFPLHKTYLSNYLSTTHGVTPLTATTVTRAHLFSYSLYTSICAIPGPLIAALLIETKLLGRKRTGALITILTGLVMLLATLSRSDGAALAFTCVLSFLQYAGLSILTTYTLEILPSPVRGCGMAAMGSVWGLFGLVAKIIEVYAGSTGTGGAPVWFCGAVWIALGGAWFLGPGESGGRAAA